MTIIKTGIHLTLHVISVITKTTSCTAINDDDAAKEKSILLDINITHLRTFSSKKPYHQVFDKCQHLKNLTCVNVQSQQNAQN